MTRKGRTGRRAGHLPPVLLIAMAAALAACSSPSPAASVPATASLPTAATSSVSPTPASETQVPPASSPAESPSASAPAETARPTDVAAVRGVASTYVLDLIAGRYKRAWNLLAARSQQQAGSLAAFTAERAAFFRSAGTRFTVSAADNLPSALQHWLPSDFTGVAGRAFVLRVDYPKLAGNNAGWEMFVVAPNANGAWRIWVVR